MNLAQLRRDYLLPAAIVAAGLLIAFTVYAVRTERPPQVGGGAPDQVRPITPADRIMGNPEARVRIVEYADIDSAYGKRFQATLQQIMSEYAATGEVAWVYRHFPLLDQNPASASHAEAAECAAFLGDDDAFWRFIDALQSAAPGETRFPVSGYGSIALGLGIPEEPFLECLQNGRFTQKVYEDGENALRSGAEGSPYTVILVDGEPPRAIQGAVPYEDMKRIIDEALARSA